MRNPPTGHFTLLAHKYFTEIKEICIQKCQISSLYNSNIRNLISSKLSLQRLHFSGKADSVLFPKSIIKVTHVKLQMVSITLKQWFCTSVKIFFSSFVLKLKPVINNLADFLFSIVNSFFKIFFWIFQFSNDFCNN